MIYARYKLERLSELLSEPWGDLRIPGLLCLIEKVKPKYMIEIGSFRGVSTEVFLLHAKHVTAIDPWEDHDVYSSFHSRCSAYTHLEHIRGYSPNAVPFGSYDFAYIDGDHSYDAVRKDIEVCLKRHLDWIGGHDFNGVDTPDVAKAVYDTLPGKHVQLFPDSSWLIKL